MLELLCAHRLRHPGDADPNTTTDPLLVDTDNDGLNDSEEVAAGTDLFDPDTDDDNRTDGAELKEEPFSDPLLTDFLKAFCRSGTSRP